MGKLHLSKLGNRPNVRVPGLAEMYVDQMLSLSQIAARTGLPPSRINRQLKAEGVTLRTRTEGFLLRTDRKPHVVPKKRRTIN